MNIKNTLLSIFAAFLSLFGLGSHSASPQVVKPPVDLNKPVTNPKFVVVLEKHQKRQTNESAVELFAELKKAVFLVAIVLDRLPAPTGEGQALFKKGDLIKVIELRDASDKRLLALFTDHEQLNKWTKDANSTLVMPTKDAMNFVIEKGYDGMVINPASEAMLRLDTTFIQKVVKEM